MTTISNFVFFFFQATVEKKMARCVKMVLVWIISAIVMMVTEGAIVRCQVGLLFLNKMPILTELQLQNSNRLQLKKLAIRETFDSCVCQYSTDLNLCKITRNAGCKIELK